MSGNSHRIIFVHGFGGDSGDMPFHDKLQESIKKYKLPFDVGTHRWDSGSLDTLRMVAQYTEACACCDDEAEKLRNSLTQLGEEEKCYLVGFSLGARIVWLALKGLGVVNWPSNLQGAILIGAALDRDVTLGFNPPEDRLLVNYQSKIKDWALMASENASGAASAGRHGLALEHSFQSHSVQCSHLANPYNAYPVLAEPVALLIAWHAGFRQEGKTEYNLRFPTFGGNHSWHTLYRTKKRVLIQQNLHTKHYRGIEETGTRLAWGWNLHGVLAEAERKARN